MSVSVDFMIAGLRSAVGSAADSRARGSGFNTQSNHILSFSFRSKKGSCQSLTKYVHEVLVNCLGGLSMPRKSVVRLTDRSDMTIAVYRGRLTTKQQ